MKRCQEGSLTWNIKHNFIEPADRQMSEKTVTEGEPEFSDQQLIWGKVTGHPWWPGIVSTLPDSLGKKLYRVDFFGDPPTHSILPNSKILRYEEYSKALSQGRPGPQLKRAIYEASVFQSTIQQSKISLDPKEPPTRVELEKNNFPHLKSPSSILPPRNIQKKIGELKSPISEQTIGHLYSGNSQVKNIPKGKKRIKKINFIQTNQTKQIKCNRRERRQMVQSILRKYRLYQIPKPKEQKVQENTEPIDIEKLIMRKIYKILKKRGESKELKEKVLSLKGKISSCSQLRSLIKTMSQAAEDNDN